MVARSEDPGAQVVPNGAEHLEIQLVAMRRRHLRSVLRIEAQVHPRPWTMGLFLSELNLDSRSYWVARIAGRVVGYGGLMLSFEDAHVTNISVDPRWQGQRIASHLMAHLTRDAVARGAQRLTLEVRVSNEPAQALYRRFGMAPAGVRKGYYIETNEDALIMWADAIDTPDYRARVATIEASLPGHVTIDPPVRTP